MNTQAIERATKILEQVKADLADMEARRDNPNAPVAFSEKGLAQLKDQLAKREAILADLKAK